MNESVCGVSNFAVGVTIVSIAMTVFIVAVNELIVLLLTKLWLYYYYNKKNPDAKLRMRDFLKFPLIVKVLLIIFGILPLLFMLLTILFVVVWYFLFSTLTNVWCYLTPHW